jgi:hypothetical protein
MADGVRDGAPGGLGGIAPVNIDAHAHFGDTAHTCHQASSRLFCVENRSAKRCILGRRLLWRQVAADMRIPSSNLPHPAI